MSHTQLVVVAVFAAVGGLCVGSFVSVVIDRMPYPLEGPNEFGDLWGTRPWRQVSGGSSRCSSCGAPVRATDNVPVVGWLRLRGRCRECSEAIPAWLLWVELAVPVLGAWQVYSLGWGWRVLPVLWLVPVGVAIAAIDLRAYIVPTRIVWPAWFVSLALSVAAAGATGRWRWLSGGAIGAASLAGPLFVIWFVHPAGMGFGDVRLTVLLGWTVGFVAAGASPRPVASVFLALCSLCLAAVLGLFLAFGALSFRGRKAKVPFGPTLVLGTLVCVAYVPQILRAFRVAS